MSSAHTALDRCDALAACTEEPGRVTRPYGTPALRQAIDLVSEWMRAAGLEVTVDAVGNVRGRRAGPPAAATLLLGSHIDSVRDAGRYDGPLGVTAALAAVERLRAAELPFAVEVVAFADEEGLRFGTSYLGSRVLAGSFDTEDLSRPDSGGVTLEQAVRELGGDPGALSAAAWDGGPLLGYLEVHIEQGPVLEERGLPVAVVSAIAGQTHAFMSVEGVAGHAGTVPMALRHDALAAAAEVVTGVEAEARARPGLVATVGVLEVEPGAANVIPGRAQLVLDARHADDAERLDAVSTILAGAEITARRRGCVFRLERRTEAAAVQCDPWLVATLSEAVTAAGQELLVLPSGAGHDAVPMSELTSVAMLFVRCGGGVSHQPAESVEELDVEVAIDVVSRSLELLARRT